MLEINTEIIKGLLRSKRITQRAYYSFELLKMYELLCKDKKELTEQNLNLQENFRKEEITKCVEEYYSTINPEICKNCKNKWRISTSDMDVVWSCVNDFIEDITGRNELVACLIGYDFNKEKSLVVKNSNKHEFTTLYPSLDLANLSQKEDVVFRVQDITEELKEICSKIYVYKDECPYFIEHKLCEMNKK